MAEGAAASGWWRTLLGVRAALCGRFLRPRYDVVAIAGIRREHTVITHKIETRRRDKRGELLDQFQRRKSQMRGPVGPRRLACETECAFVKDTELTCGQWRP